MATGVKYTDNIIVGDFACDIQSIVRYRGGFVWHAYAKNLYYGYTLNPLTPIWINFTTREVFPLIDTWTYSSIPKPDADTNHTGWGFLYQQTEISREDMYKSMTVIMKAREISMTALTQVTYLTRLNETYVPKVYRNLLTSADERTALMEKFPDSNFIYA